MRFKILIIVIFMGFLGPQSAALAIDLSPGDVRAPPAGLKALRVNYQQSQLDNSDANLSFRSEQLQVRLGGAFTVSEMPAYAFVQVPLVRNTEQSSNPNVPDVGSVSGLGDTSLVFAVWPHADPVQRRYFGLAAYLFLPTGDYDPERLSWLNTGANRTSFALQIGYERPVIPRLQWMSAADALWFGSNDAWGPDRQKREQKPLYSAQTGLQYLFPRGQTLGFAYLYNAGGAARVDGGDYQNRVENQRLQITGTWPVPTRAGFFSLQYGTKVSTQAGFIEAQRWSLTWIQLF